MPSGHISYLNNYIQFNKPRKPLFPNTAMIEDHFTYGAGAFNSHVPQYWTTTETGAATPFAPSASSVGGAAIAVTGGTTNNGEEIAGTAVIWQPSTMGILTFPPTGPLVFECRAKFVGTTTAKDGDYYIGFANAVTYTNSLPYVVGASSLLTTSAPVEFAGFGYSSIPSSGVWFNSAGNNFIGLVTEINSVAPALKATTTAKDSNFHIYRVELQKDGNALFFLDGVRVGATTSAVTATTALTPYVVAIAKNSHTHTATIDRMFVRGDVI